MKTVKVSFEVDEGLARRLQQSATLDDEKLRKLAALAFQEWAEWMLGTRRPVSISDLFSERVRDIFFQLYGAYPKTAEVMERCKLPFGRARYIVTNIGYLFTPENRDLVRSSLREKLRQPIEEKDDIVAFRLERAERYELEVLVEEGLRAGRLKERPEVVQEIGDLFTARMTKKLQGSLNQALK